MKYCVLGPVEVADGEHGVSIKQAKERKLLAILLLNANTVVSVDRLLELMWGENQPASGLKALHYHVAKLRDALRPGRKGTDGTGIQTRSPGYVLVVADDELDSDRFSRLAADGRRLLSTDPDQAERFLAQALGLWRGTAYAEFEFEDFAQSEIVRLGEERLGAVELGFQAQLALGRHENLIPKLTALVTEYPYREALRETLITALYRAGRQVDALRSYTEMRTLLGDELGLDPSPELVALEEQVLQHGESLRAPIASVRRNAFGTTFPAQVTSFIGRNQELLDLAEELKASRLVTIMGPGGSGKTRLAIEVSIRMVDAFRDGAIFVDLAAVRDPDLVEQAVFDAERASESPERTLRAALIEHLAKQQVLIVMDNCEHVVETAAAVIASLIANTAAVTVLATSQHLLRVSGETVVQVPPLQAATSTDAAAILESDAGQLFTERARSARPGFTPSNHEVALISELTSRLDGAPLAIELAAARMRMMSLSEINTHLAGRLRLLTNGSRTPERQSTLEATVSWSYQLMQEDEQHFFDRLSLFAGVFTHEAAAQISGSGDTLETLVLLGQLVDKSLVAIDQSGGDIRYRMLETTRLFGRDKLAERGELHATSEKHSDYFRDLVRDGDDQLSGPGQGACQTQFRRATPDIRSALEWMLKNKPQDALLSVRGLGRYWFRESNNSEGLGWLHRALEAGDSTPSADRAHALRWQAAIEHRAELTHDWASINDQAIAMAREINEITVVAASLNARGSDYLGRGLVSEAIQTYEEALGTLDDPGAQLSIFLLWNIGVAHLEAADVEATEMVIARFRRVLAGSGHSAESESSANLLEADVAIVRGQLGKARELAEAARKAFERMDSPIEVAEALDRLAHVSVLTGDLAGAHRHLALASGLRVEVSGWYTWEQNLVRCQLAVAEGDASEARVALRALMPVVRDRQLSAILSKALHEGSRLAFLDGEIGTATLLVGAVSEISTRPNVTVQANIMKQSVELRGQLTDASDEEVIDREVRRGANMSTGELLDVLDDVVRAR